VTVANWGDSYRYYYDKFIIRWYLNGTFIGQEDVPGAGGSPEVGGIGGRVGHWSKDVKDSGIYTVEVEGCDTGPLGSTCNQKFTVPATVNVTIPNPNINIGCNILHADQQILARWKELDGRDGPLGCPTGPEHPIAGQNGIAMPFDHGEIATSPKQGDNMVLAVYQQGDDLVANFGDTSQYNYDFFIARASYNGILIDQTDIKNGPRTSGVYKLNQPSQGAGRYSVVVEGCDSHGLLPSTCIQGFTVPASVNYSPFGVLNISELTTPKTVDEALGYHKQRAARIAADFVACEYHIDPALRREQLPADIFKNEDDFVNIAIAKLYVVNDIVIPPNQTSDSPGPRCIKARFPMTTEVNNAIRHSGD
jgi:hypothetical protein